MIIIHISCYFSLPLSGETLRSACAGTGQLPCSLRELGSDELSLRELGSDELSLCELGSDELSWTASVGHGKHSGHASSVSSLFLVPRTHGEFSWLLSWEPAGILSAKLNEAELLRSLLTFYKLSFLKSFTLPSSLGEPFGVSRELCRSEKITAGS